MHSYDTLDRSWSTTGLHTPHPAEHSLLATQADSVALRRASRKTRACPALMKLSSGIDGSYSGSSENSITCTPDITTNNTIPHLSHHAGMS
jgi:hypothetical protein